MTAPLARVSAILIALIGVNDMRCSTASAGQQTTGFNAFRIQNPSEAFQTGFGSGGPFAGGYYNCVQEAWGAVVNYCQSGPHGPVSRTIDSSTVIITVNFAFDLPISGSGNKRIQVHDYGQSWAGNNQQFSCQPYSYRGGTSTVDATGPAMTFTQPGQLLSTQINIQQSLTGMTVICWNVPTGAGISFLEWDQ